MKKIVLLLICISSFLYGDILTNLDKTEFKRYKGDFKKILKSEKEYNSGLKYLTENLKSLDILKKELDKVNYNNYSPNKEAKELQLLKTMNYMKLLTLDTLKNLKSGNEKEFIKSLSYEIKFFKIVLKKNVLINQMIVVANELTLFTGINNLLKIKDSYKKSRELIKNYYDFRKVQFVKTMKGEFEFMNKELAISLDTSQDFPAMKKKDVEKIVSYVTKKVKIKNDKIILGFKNRKDDNYFKDLDKESKDPDLSSKVFRTYLILGLSVVYRDINKPYQLPNIYLELIGDILLSIGSLTGSTYNQYYKKDLEVINILEKIISQDN